MSTFIDLHNLTKNINPSFLPLLHDKNRFLVMRGGAGSGKSVFAAQKMLTRILANYQTVQHNFLVVRKYQPQIRKSVFPLIKYFVDRWHLEGICRPNKTESSFYFDNGSQILCMGLDDPEKIKSITGITSIWAEEASELLLDDFRELNRRMRGLTDTYYQLMLTFNPISMLNWLYAEFFLEKKWNATLHHSTYKDNLFLDDAYKEELLGYEQQDYNSFRIYTLGEFGLLDGVIYQYDVVEEMPDETPVYGIDFGWNTTAVVEVYLSHNNKDLYVNEVLYEHKITNAELINRLIAEGIPYDAILYCDAAEPDRIREIQAAGFTKAVAANKQARTKGKNNVRSGIDFIKSKNLFITKSSTNVIKEVQGYAWAMKKDGTPTEEPSKVNDHSMDAMRYAAFSHYGLPKREYGLVLAA